MASKLDTRRGTTATWRRLLGKKWIVAALLGSVAFSSVYAFAATLNVTSKSLGAGNQAVATCTSAVTSSYSTAYDSTLGSYRVSSITLAGLVVACVGKAITIDLTGAANVSLGEVTYGPITAANTTAGNVAIAVPATGTPFPVNAALVTGVSVAIAG